MTEDITMIPAMTIGCDLGDRYSYGCVLDHKGSVLERFRFETTRIGMHRAFKEIEPCRVVIEVGTHSPWISRALEELGHEVIVANAREVQSITKSDRKNDPADAEQLARLGRVDVKLLHPIHHRKEDTQRDRAVLTTRDKLVRTRASLAVQAGGIAKGLGERLPKGSPEGLSTRVRNAGLEDLFPGLSCLLTVIEVLNAKILELDRKIAKLSKQTYPETRLLRQIPGVGPIAALAYVLTIEDPNRFPRSRTVGAYLGMKPRQRDSGNRSPQLPITKAGDRYLRWILVQCAQYILNIGGDCDLQRYGKRIKERGGPGVHPRATVAVARKLAVLLHSLWRTAEVYEPLRQARISQAAA